MSLHRVVILGGGFGGLYAAKSLADPGLEVTLVDRRNFHLFQPLLYQVATGGLSPADIAAPLRSILKRHHNVRVIQQPALDLDPDAGEVILRDERLAFDTLIVATGVRHHYFGNPEWEAFAPGLKTIEDATTIRARILQEFEDAEQTAGLRPSPLTFVVIGGGPTGVELAGAIGELAHHTLPSEFRRIDTAAAKILLLEAGPRILPAYPETLSAHAADALGSLGVDVRTGSLVTHIENDYLVIRDADGEQRVEASCVLWAAGVKASSMGQVLNERVDAPVDRAGRVLVTPTLNVPGRDDIFVIGDLAALADPDSDRPLPGVAPVAMQQGAYVARVVAKRLAGQPTAQFRYRDRGSMAVIGRARAVARLLGRNVHGYPAWLLWLFVHVLYLVAYESRLIVLIQWAWSYLTRNRRARLITRGGREEEDPAASRK